MNHIKMIMDDSIYDMVLNQAMSAAKKEAENFKKSMSKENADLVDRTVRTMVKEHIDLLRSKSAEDERRHVRNLELCASTLSNVTAVASIDAYNRTLDVIGRTIGSVAVAAAKALI